MRTQLKSSEKVILVTRPHWLTLAVPAFMTLVAVVAGFIIGGYGLFLVLAAAIYFLYKGLERNRNIWAVTNLRVIDEFGVFTNNSKESPLDKINNVSFRQSLWGKIFGFGNVQIQTAAEIGSTTYTMVQGPARLKDSITQMQEEYKDYQMKKQAAMLADAMVAAQKKDTVQ